MQMTTDFFLQMTNIEPTFFPKGLHVLFLLVYISVPVVVTWCDQIKAAVI
jgi:hypothetical protein